MTGLYIPGNSFLHRIGAGPKLIVLGAVLWLGTAAAIIKGLICIVFILITSSTAAHALSRAAHRAGVPLCEGSVVDRYAADLNSEGEAS